MVVDSGCDPFKCKGAHKTGAFSLVHTPFDQAWIPSHEKSLLTRDVYRCTG
jgi:hypothetical protein